MSHMLLAYMPACPHVGVDYSILDDDAHHLRLTSALRSGSATPSSLAPVRTAGGPAGMGMSGSGGASPAGLVVGMDDDSEVSAFGLRATDAQCVSVQAVSVLGRMTTLSALPLDIVGSSNTNSCHSAASASRGNRAMTACLKPVM